MIFGWIVGLSSSSPRKEPVKKLAPQARGSLLRPLPLRERATRCCQAMNGWGVFAQTPHPFEIVGTPLCPLPQGERAREATPRRRHDFFTGAKAGDPVTTTLS